MTLPKKMMLPNVTLGAIAFALLVLVGCDSNVTDSGATKVGSEHGEDITMIKLYKKQNGRWHYHEAWIDDQEIIEHWGIVGERGDTRKHSLPSGDSKAVALRNVLETAYDSGYKEVDLHNHSILLVEYAVDGFGTSEDLDKRVRLEDRLSETLGWTGLGHCDGGSIGSGTMEAACFVIDFEVAKAVVTKELEGTEFANFTRIYNERAPQD